MAPSTSDGEASSSGTGSKSKEKERPRSFDEKTRTACWRKAAVLAGRHPERWRQDAAGNVVCRRFWSCHGCLCYEYDHIIPFSKGGESTVENCQILQTRANRSKSDKAWVEKAEMQGFSCDIKFTDEFLIHDLLNVIVLLGNSVTETHLLIYIFPSEIKGNRVLKSTAYNLFIRKKIR
ncbi:unnamed protein product [Triticum turgidum subsp. durum]|uniref:HNH nuclease domain-containing protein n=1 Tax=Triticum turgidum subsp. durum TaxID=4567 RepID=A0A9R0Y2G0_TRITD|nr:unnamed protein product [Triticum turgidum subsp. durum]